MNISTTFYNKTFAHEDKKEAYKRATNWIAKYIVTSRDDNKETIFKIEEIKNTAVPTFKVILMCSLETKDEEDSFCESCKSYHKAFFINQEYNCNACKYKAFLNRMSDKLSVKMNYRRDKLKHKLENNNL